MLAYTSDFVILTILAAGNTDGDDTLWMQMLVFVILAASWGVYSLVKNKPDNFKDRQQNYIENTHPAGTVARWKSQLLRRNVARRKAVTQKYATKAQSPELPEEPVLDFDNPDTASWEKPKNDLVREKGKDLHGGMELLDLDFLLSAVEHTEGKDENDVTMRKLNFNELLRRKKLSQADSNVLKVYAINQGNLYGKDIQCEAIRQLAERTMRKSKHSR